MQKRVIRIKKSYETMSSIDLSVMLIPVLVAAFGLSGIAVFCLRNSTESKFIRGVCIVTVWFIGSIGTFFVLTNGL